MTILDPQAIAIFGLATSVESNTIGTSTTHAPSIDTSTTHAPTEKTTTRPAGQNNPRVVHPVNKPDTNKGDGKKSDTKPKNAEEKVGTTVNPLPKFV